MKKDTKKEYLRDECDTVELELEDDSILECAVYRILEAEDREYAVLLPLDKDGCSDGEEYFIYRYWERDGEAHVEYIHDDEEYERIVDQYEELLDDEAFDEL